MTRWQRVRRGISFMADSHATNHVCMATMSRGWDEPKA